MNKKKYLSAISFFLVTMMLGGVWHLNLFKEKYHTLGASTRDEPTILLGMTSVILQALIFSYFYPMYLKYKGQPASIGNGIKYSLLMGVNVWTVMVLTTGAKILIEPIWDFIFLGTAFHLIQFILVGISFGFIHKRFSDGLR